MPKLFSSLKKGVSPLFSNGMIWIITIVQFVLCVFFYAHQNTEGAFINLFLYWLVVFTYSIYVGPNGLILMAFLISFFVFLLGRDVFVSLFSFDVVDTYLYSIDCIAHTYFCMHLSLIGVLSGFLVTNKGNSKNNMLTVQRNSSTHLYKKVILSIFYLTLVFYILSLVLNIYNFLFLGTRGHHNLYILEKIVQIHFLMFCGFLMLAPSKKELLPLLKIDLTIQFLTLLTGSRGDFMYFAVFVFCYLLFRDYYSKRDGLIEEVFITKKVRWALIISMPFFVIFLGLYASLRLGQEAETTGFSNDIGAFFIQQGGSSTVIGYAKYYEESFPDTNISYTFGPLINFVKYGILGKIPGNHMPGFEEAPMYANNMGATITWLVNPEYYYAGGGLGNQYIAELYKDFGYLGVFIFSILLGVIVRKFVFFSSRSWVLNVLMMTGIQAIISMPRDFYLNWLIGIISLLNILVLLAIRGYVSKKTRLKT